MVWWRVVLMCLLDYVLAYTSLGLGGAFAKKTPKKALVLGVILSLGVCYFFHVLSGAAIPTAMTTTATTASLTLTTGKAVNCPVMTRKCRISV